MQVVFTDPPPPQTTRRNRQPPQAHPWESIAAQVRARPGEWALVLRDIYVVATTISRGHVKVFRPAGSWQARTVQTGNRDEHGRRLVDLYIRYVGHQTPGKETS